jgi:hypothetical protein
MRSEDAKEIISKCEDIRNFLNNASDILYYLKHHEERGLSLILNYIATLILDAKLKLDEIESMASGEAR